MAKAATRNSRISPKDAKTASSRSFAVTSGCCSSSFFGEAFPLPLSGDVGAVGERFGVGGAAKRVGDVGGGATPKAPADVAGVANTVADGAGVKGPTTAREAKDAANLSDLGNNVSVMSKTRSLSLKARKSSVVTSKRNGC